MTHLTRVTMRIPHDYAGLDGRYWARTSDPQLVERAEPSAAGRDLSPIRVAEPLREVLRHRSFASVRHRLVPKLFHLLLWRVDMRAHMTSAIF
jgi:hypothetical protein